MKSQKIELIIFDRDGTLIEDVGYPFKPQDLQWKPGALELLGWLNKNGILVAIATNQSGVARGYFTLDQVGLFHELMLKDVKTAGGDIAMIKICPHLISSLIPEYSVDCLCRKPGSGMIKSILNDLNIQPSKALMIGDRSTDITAGCASGVASYLFGGENLKEFVLEILADK